MYESKGLHLEVGKRYVCNHEIFGTSTWICTKVPQNDFEMVGAQVEHWRTTSPTLKQYTDANLRNLVLGWKLSMEPSDD